MEEIILDQEEVALKITDDVQEDSEETDYSDFSDDDFTVKDESEIDWSNL